MINEALGDIKPIELFYSDEMVEKEVKRIRQIFDRSMRWFDDDSDYSVEFDELDNNDKKLLKAFFDVIILHYKRIDKERRRVIRDERRMVLDEELKDERGKLAFIAHCLLASRGKDD